MKKYLFCVFLLWSAFTGINARDGFAIVIDPKSYNEARQEVEAYAQCVEQLHHLKVYTVADRWGIPDSIRATLKALHERKKEPVVGAVFIGDIPVVMVRDGQHMTSAFKMDQRTDRRQSSIPSDRFYDDFGLKFKYLDKDSVMPYYYYSVTADSRQHLEPTIYSGRIHPTDAGGTSRYDKLRKYLKKLVAEKQKEQHLQKMFYFSGHGYISESKVARIDEKAAWFEHYPWLKNRFDNIGYMDHTDHNPVKRHLMNELMRTDLDLAVLHHHGYWDTQYLNGMKQILTVRQAKEFIMQASREHIYGAKQKGRDYEKMQKDIKEKFDLPDSWFKDALSDSLARLDSLEGAMEDLHLEDFAEYNYHPNTPVVIIDACFCGSFHKEDCIANEYIFQPGHTVAVIANTVNVLQDKWSDRLAGLIAEGGCVGDIVRYATYRESHVIGDPTFRFTPQGESVDIDHIILDEVKVVPGFRPRLPGGFAKLILEFLVASIVRELTLQIGQMRNRSGEALHLVKDAKEHRDNGILGLLAGHLAFGIDIEKDDVGRDRSRQPHVRQHHRVPDLFVIHEIVDGLFAVDFPVSQQIGQDFQKVRFTASKEAGHPNAHLVCSADNPTLVAGEEIPEMLLKLTGDNVLVQLLADIGIVVLTDLDDTLNVTVYRFCKHIFDDHCVVSFTLQV